ncbi:MAG: DUF4174 domain-containing protein [Desulfobacterales bacterium]
MDFDQFQWKNRLLFLFAPHGSHPIFTKLQSEIYAQKAEVKDRDLVIFEVLGQGPSRMNTTQLNRGVADAIRNRFDAPQKTFTLILVGKDGGIKMKRHDGANIKEVFELIDSMPMRQNEMQRKRPSF